MRLCTCAERLCNIAMEVAQSAPTAFSCMKSAMEVLEQGVESV